MVIEQSGAGDLACAGVLERMRDRMLAWMKDKGDPNYLTLGYYLKDLTKKY